MYQQIVVIGSGRVASQTLNTVLRLPERPPVMAVEPESSLTDTLGATCRRHKIPCFQITDHNSLIRFFHERPAGTLVLSAHNVFIFPPALVDGARLTIINFHNSLLPRHRGRNAPSWALFERDPWVGISWHRVTAGIDKGDILCQRRMRPTWDATALSLTQTLVDLGIEALGDLLPELLSGQVKTTPQDRDVSASFHHSSDVPNDGFLETCWPFAQASAFLRALDFGKLPLFPQPRVELPDGERLIAGYRLTESDSFAPEPVARQTDHELEFYDADLKLTVSLAPAAILGRHREPVSQGSFR